MTSNSIGSRKSPRAGFTQAVVEARNIKQEIIERGQSANLKVDLLNDELEDARGRIGSLEKALVAAREAIRVLQRGGSGSSTVKVSLPSSSTAGLSSPRRETSLFTNPIGGGGTFGCPR